MRAVRVNHKRAKLSPVTPSPEVIEKASNAFWVAFGTMTLVQEGLVLPTLSTASDEHCDRVRAGTRAAIISYLVQCGATLEQIGDA